MEGAWSPLQQVVMVLCKEQVMVLCKEQVMVSQVGGPLGRQIYQH